MILHSQIFVEDEAIRKQLYAARHSSTLISVEQATEDVAYTTVPKYFLAHDVFNLCRLDEWRHTGKRNVINWDRICVTCDASLVSNCDAMS